MEAGDFDRDGDIDLVGASATGTIIVLENRGNFLEAPNAHRTEYPSPTPGKFGANSLQATDLNGDGDLDFVVGSPNGVMHYEGAEGMKFVLTTATLASFVFSVYPTPERSNADNGSVEPRVDLIRSVEEGNSFEEPFQPPRPGRAIRFYARGRDDVGIVTLSLLYRRLDVPTLSPTGSSSSTTA